METSVVYNPIPDEEAVPEEPTSHLSNVRIKRVLSDHDYGNREISAEVIVRPGETVEAAVTAAAKEIDAQLGEWQTSDGVRDSRREYHELRNEIYQLQRIKRGLECPDDAEAPDDFDPFVVDDEDDEVI